MKVWRNSVATLLGKLKTKIWYQMSSLKSNHHRKNFQTGVPRVSTSSVRMLNFMVFSLRSYFVPYQLLWYQISILKFHALGLKADKILLLKNSTSDGTGATSILPVVSTSRAYLQRSNSLILTTLLVCRLVSSDKICRQSKRPKT